MSPARAAFALLIGFVPAACSSKDEPEATSLLGKLLRAPPLSAEAREKREADLEAARQAYEKNPDSIEAIVWLGRRTAYLGHYRDAIAIYSEGLKKQPDEPHLLRHRGHRFVTTRRFDLARTDFERAAAQIKGKPDEVEPDGMPNARNIPTSTLQFNIWYHLGLVRYLTLDFEAALEAYRECLKVSKNPDALCATTHWYWMTLRHLGRAEEAAALLQPISADLDVIENHGYHHLLLMYKGERQPEDLLASAEEAGEIQSATVAYGVANWFLLNDREDEAEQLFGKIVAGEQWPAFGHIAAEVELANR